MNFESFEKAKALLAKHPHFTFKKARGDMLKCQKKKEQV